MKSWVHILVSRGESLELEVFYFAINAEKALAEKVKTNANSYVITKNINDFEEIKDNG